jgi:hypothetical protein
VVSLRKHYDDLKSEASIGDFTEPPSPAEWTNNVQSPISMIQQRPMDYFIAAVHSSIHAATGPLESSTPSGVWLSALIQMEVAGFAKEWNTVVSQWSPSLTTLSLLHASLESSRRVIMAFEEHIPDIRRSDYALSLSRLGLLSEEVKSGKTKIEEELNNQYRTSSVQEARNAVSCEFPDPRTSEVA